MFNWESQTINWTFYKIDIDLLLKNQENLKQFTNSLNKNILKIIYANHKNDIGDWKMADHMIERFESFGCDPASFFSGTPGEQYKFNLGCNLNMGSSEAIRAMEFFKFIKYSIGIYHIEAMFGVEYVQLWKKYDSINFFFVLPYNFQVKVIEEYNIKFDNIQ